MPVLAVSDGIRADNLECYPALEPARVHVIRNGIGTSIYHATDDRSVLTGGPARTDRLVRRADHPTEGRGPL